MWEKSNPDGAYSFWYDHYKLTPTWDWSDTEEKTVVSGWRLYDIHSMYQEGPIAQLGDAVSDNWAIKWASDMVRQTLRKKIETLQVDLERAEKLPRFYQGLELS